MKINTVLLDMDGTITDSLPLIRETFHTLFQEMGIPWGDDDVMKLIGLPLRQIGSMMAGEDRAEHFFSTYQERYRTRHAELMRLFPGTEDFLHTLRRQGHALGLVTAKSRRGTDLTLDFLQIRNFFDVIVTVEDSPEHKPSPAPVLTALEKLGRTREQTIFIGDSPFDIQSGNRAGVVTAAVSWGMASLSQLREHNPTLCIQSWPELLTWLQETNESF